MLLFYFPNVSSFSSVKKCWVSNSLVQNPNVEFRRISLRYGTIEKHWNSPKWVSWRCGTICKHRELTKMGQLEVWQYRQTLEIHQNGLVWVSGAVDKHRKLTKMGQFEVWHYLQTPKIDQNGLASGVALSRNTGYWPKWINLRCGTIDKHNKWTKMGQLEVWQYRQTPKIDQNGSTWGVALSRNTGYWLKWVNLRYDTIKKHWKFTKMG